MIDRCGKPLTMKYVIGNSNPVSAPQLYIDHRHPNGIKIATHTRKSLQGKW